MTDRELMQMALDAMESFEGGTNGLYKGEFAEERKALRERLAQPEPEPVAWIHHKKGYKMQVTEHSSEPLHKLPDGFKTTPVYTTPPKREWVGFTAAERDEIVPMLVQSLINHDDKTMAMLLRAIFIDVEERLKEKNSG